MPSTLILASIYYDYEQAEARLWGGEFRAELHPHPLDLLHLHLSGDWTHPRNLDTGDALPFSPPRRLRAEVAVEQGQITGLEEVMLRFGSTFVADQNRVDPTEMPTAGYTLWHLSVDGNIQVGDILVSPVLAVDNLFNEAYLDHLSRLRPFEVLSPGRNIRLQVRATF